MMGGGEGAIDPFYATGEKVGGVLLCPGCNCHHGGGRGYVVVAGGMIQQVIGVVKL